MCMEFYIKKDIDVLRFNNLKKLRSFENIDYEILKQLKDLTYLEFHKTQDKEIPNTLTQQTHLDCSYAQDIPNTYINLTYLNCSYTRITNIPNTFIHLTY